MPRSRRARDEISRKQELLRAQARVGSAQRGLDGSIRSDVNPEAGVNLRSRSVLDNARSSLEKQQELKSRSKKRARADSRVWRLTLLGVAWVRARKLRALARVHECGYSIGVSSGRAVLSSYLHFLYVNYVRR